MLSFIATSWPRPVLIRRVLGTLFIALLALSTAPATYAAPGYAITSGTPPAGTYNTAYSHTFTASGGGGAPYTFSATGTLPPGLSLSTAGVLSGTPTQAGSFPNITISATGRFFGAGSATYTITINKATPTITWANPAAITYGTALSATQLNATASVPGTFSYTPALGTVLNAGNAQTLSVSFTPTNSANYTTKTATVALNVNKAALTVTVTAGQSRAYGAANPTLTYTVGGLVNGDTAAVLTGSLATTAIAASPVGSYPITQGTLAPNGNYTITTFTGNTLSVTKATPTITWANPAAITYGTALGATQLNAAASVPGTFSYTPALGTVLNAGNAQTLSVSFTPTDGANYTTKTATVALTVNKAALTVTANDLTRREGASTPAFTVGYTGFVNGEDASALRRHAGLRAGADHPGQLQYPAQRADQQQLHDQLHQRGADSHRQGRPGDHLGQPGRDHLRHRAE